MTTLENIKQHPVYKQILADSFGGIMYNLSNIGKYDTTELLKLWGTLTDSQKDSTDGIVKGVFDFLQDN